MKLWPFSLSSRRRRAELAAKMIHETENKKGSHGNTSMFPRDFFALSRTDTSQRQIVELRTNYSSKAACRLTYTYPGFAHPV